MYKDQLFVGSWRSLILLPQDSNLPSVRLTAPQFNTNKIHLYNVGADNCISLTLAMTLATRCVCTIFCTDYLVSHPHYGKKKFFI